MMYYEAAVKMQICKQDKDFPYLGASSVSWSAIPSDCRGRARLVQQKKIIVYWYKRLAIEGPLAPGKWNDRLRRPSTLKIHEPPNRERLD